MIFTGKPFFQSGLLLAALALTPAVFASEMATATFAAVPSGSGYDYYLTLYNTGTTTIGTFWFSWIPGGGFLSVAPTDVTSPDGWTDTLTNTSHAIQWKSTVSSSLLEPGQFLSGFDFYSTETPAELLQDFTSGSHVEPGDIAYIYEGAPMSDPGFELTVVPTPEPAGLILTFTGLMAVIGLYKRNSLGLA